MPSITERQHETSVGEGTPLDFSPTAGRLLIACYWKRNGLPGGSTIPEDEGWTALHTGGGGGGFTDGMKIWGRDADGTETDFPAISLLGSGAGDARLNIIEVEGAVLADVVVGTEVFSPASGATSIVASVTPDSGAPTLLLAYGDSGSDTIAAEWSVSGGWTIEANVIGAGGHPIELVASQEIAVAVGSYSLTASQASNDFNRWLVILALGGEPPEIVPGPVFSVDGVAFENLLEQRVRFEWNAPGAGYMVLSKGDPQATPAMVYRGAIVECTFPEIHDEPLFEFYLEEGDFDAISSDEEGGEELRFGGPGTLSILRRAIVRSEEFLDGIGYPKPNRGVWKFDENNTEGHILNKLVREAQAAGRPAHPLAGMTRTFDSDTDSDGEDWDDETLEGFWRVKIGTNLYDAALRLVNSGLMHIEMRPGLILDCWRNRGVSRVSSSFAANKVRFVKGVNIVDELTKVLAGQHFATHAEVKFVDNDDDIHYINATKDAGDFSYDKEVYIEVEASHANTARRQAKHAMKLREDAQDAIEFSHTVPWPGDPTDELNGLYLPGPVWSDRGQYWLGDIVTLDTGDDTTEFEWNNQSKRVYAITLYTDATGYLAPPIVELNAPRTKGGNNRLKAGLSGTLSDIGTGSSGGGGGSGGSPPIVLGGGYQPLAEKGDPEGYAGLDDDGHVPPEQLGSGATGDGVKYLRDNNTWGTLAESVEPVEVVDPASGTITIDYALARSWDIVLDGDVDIDDVDNVPVSPSGVVNRLWINLYMNGTDTVTGWPASFEWMDADGVPTATPPTLFEDADARNVIEGVSHDNGVTWGVALVNAASTSSGPVALDDLTDVDLTGFADGDVLTYDSGSGDWIAATPTPGSGGGGSTGARLYVQQGNSGWGSTNSPGFTWGAAPTNGNRIYVVVITEAGINVSSITQTNVTWTRLKESTASTTPHVEIWEGVVAASAGTGMTISMSGSDYCTAWGAEFAGLSGTLEDFGIKTAVSVANGGDGSEVIVPTTDGALVIGAMVCAGYGAGFAGFWSGQIQQAYPVAGSAGISAIGWGFPGIQETWFRSANVNSGGARSSVIVAIS